MSQETAVILILGILNSAAFVALVGVVVAALRAALVRHFGESKVSQATRIAVDAVQATEQLAQRLGYNPAIKFDEALDRARALGAANGIALTDSQWETLIESAVHGIKAAGAVFMPLQEVRGDGTGAALPPADPAPATVLKLDTTAP